MAWYRYSPKHSADDPPIGVIRGTLFGDPGQYRLQFSLANSGEIFAGPVEVKIEAGGSALADAPILRCQVPNPPSGLRTARLVSQYKSSGDEEFEEGIPRDVNYRCR
jgi:hypothetical protein